MAVRSALELSTQFRDVVASQSEDAIASFLEDLNDSVGTADLTGYVERSEYDKIVGERDAFAVQAREYRDKYINRFYQPGTKPNDITMIDGEQNQETIEEQEKAITYDDLFE